MGVVEFGGEEQIKSGYRVTLTTSASFVVKMGLECTLMGKVVSVDEGLGGECIWI